jgi:hypothetical protein
MKDKKIPSNFRLTETSSRLLGRLAHETGISKTGVLELLIRREAKIQGVRCEDSSNHEKETIL